MFTSSRKRENKHFHVVVIHWRQRNVQKSVMHVESCCSANLDLYLFRRFRCRHRRRSGRRCLCATYGQKEGTVGVWGVEPFSFFSSSYSQYALINVICGISRITSPDLCGAKRDECAINLRSLLHSRFLCRHATLLPTSKAVIGWVTVVQTPSRK